MQITKQHERVIRAAFELLMAVLVLRRKQSERRQKAGIKALRAVGSPSAIQRRPIATGPTHGLNKSLRRPAKDPFKKGDDFREAHAGYSGLS